MPTAGGVWRALQRGREVGCDVVQIFVKNNLQWNGRPFSPQELALFAAARAQTQLAGIFGHTGYLINLAAPPSPNRERSLQSLTQELELAADLDLPFLVLHPGAHLGHGESAGCQRVVEGLNEVLHATRKRPVRIALENTAGQGTTLGYRLEHLAAIIQKVRHPERLGVCLDTAHFFAAGYDLRTPAGWDETMAQTERCLGLDRIWAFHLNDSRAPLGSRVDRHAGIGQGHLGREAFRPIVRDARFALTPGCLETPKSADLHEDVENLAILRSLLTVKSPHRSRTTRPTPKK